MQQKRSRVRKRLWEVDAVRGLAVVFMVVSNFLFDLYFFVGLPISPQGWAGWLARATAGTFLLLVGVSLALRRYWRPDASFAGVARRGGMLVALGFVVSLATWLVAGEQLVLFGVLHCIGVSMVLAWPLVDRPRAALAVGLSLLALGPAVGRLHPDTLLLLPLGIAPEDFASVDYVPLAPWSGLVFLGMAVGSVLYRDGRRRFPLPEWSSRPAPRLLIALGRRSLLVYFAHQPVLLALIWAWLALVR